MNTDSEYMDADTFIYTHSTIKEEELHQESPFFCPVMLVYEMLAKIPNLIDVFSFECNCYCSYCIALTVLPFYLLCPRCTAYFLHCP